MSDNPVAQFEKWMEEAVKNGVNLSNAMHLSTVKEDRRPSGRIMLLRGFYLSPIQIEFWQGRVHRLHDRILYKLEKNNSWRIQHLYP